MYIKKGCGMVVKERRGEDSNKTNEKELAYWIDFLETAYLTQSQRGKYHDIRMNDNQSSGNGTLDALVYEQVEQYQFFCEPEACETCQSLNKRTLKLDEASLEINFPPLHLNCRCTIKPFIPNGHKVAEKGFHEWLTEYMEKDTCPFSIDQLISYRKERAEEMLNHVLDQQYPLFSPKELEAIAEETGMINETMSFAVFFQNMIASAADARMNSAYQAIDQNKEDIMEVARSAGIPPEYVAAVILKEQYTQSIPDWTAILLRKLDLTRGSTGLGAISAPTARAAWAYQIGPDEAKSLLPNDDVDLLKMLSNDNRFNIETICAVFMMEADVLGIGGNNNMDKLDDEDWHKIYINYNLSTVYADKTMAYIPYIGGLLN